MVVSTVDTSQDTEPSLPEKRSVIVPEILKQCRKLARSKEVVAEIKRDAIGIKEQQRIPDSPAGNAFAEVIAKSHVFGDIVENELTGKNNPDKFLGQIAKLDFEKKFPDQRQQLSVQDAYSRILWRDNLDNLQPDEIANLRAGLKTDQARVWKHHAGHYYRTNTSPPMMDHQILRSLQYTQSFVDYDRLLDRVHDSLGNQAGLTPEQIKSKMDGLLRTNEGEIFNLFESGCDSASFSRFIKAKDEDNIPANRKSRETPEAQIALQHINNELGDKVKEYRKLKEELRGIQDRRALDTEMLWDDYEQIMLRAEAELDAKPGILTMDEIPSMEVPRIAALYLNAKRFASKKRLDFDGKMKQDVQENLDIVLEPLLRRLGSPIEHSKRIIHEHLTDRTIRDIYEEGEHFVQRTGKKIPELQNLKKTIDEQARIRNLVNEPVNDSRGFLKKVAAKLPGRRPAETS